MAKREKLQRLSIFLLKEGVTADLVMHDKAPGQRRTIKSTIEGLEGLWTGQSGAKPPSWLQIIRSATEEDLKLWNLSCSALLAVRAANRLFAMPFGNGRNWIDEARIERRFGMKVTLNVVDPEKIKSVDREELEAVVRTTRSQTSIVSNLDNFGIDIQRDLLRSVTGKPQDEKFAKHVTGSDNLIISCPITIEQLSAKCAEALVIYGRLTYRENGFQWIDNFQRIVDPEKVEALNGKLLGELRSDEPQHVYLSPPNLVDTQEHRGFKYPSERGEPHDDIRLDAYLARIDDRAKLTIEMLEKQKIRHFTSDSEHESRSFSVYDALIYEVRDKNKLFALTRGEWFEIEETYVKEIETKISAIKSSVVTLPKALPSEKEQAYNARAAKESGGTLDLLDCKTVQFGGKHSKIEVCDLLADSRELIHVKRGSQSALLSHLFNQGVVSGQVLRDDKFREAAVKKCAISHRPLLDASFRPSKFRVTFAIVSSANGEIGATLPFFSKQSLVNAASVLNGMGYGVRLKKIEVDNPSKP